MKIPLPNHCLVKNTIVKNLYERLRNLAFRFLVILSVCFTFSGTAYSQMSLSSENILYVKNGGSAGGTNENNPTTDFDDFRWGTDLAGNPQILGQESPINPGDPANFITLWKTDNLGVSEDDQVIIPANASEYQYDYNIYWEDVDNPSVNGTMTGLVTDHTITFPKKGIYRVEIKGKYPHFYFSDRKEIDKLLTVEQWGTQKWKNMKYSFYKASFTEFTATDVPDLSEVEDMTRLFSHATSFNGDLSGWDVSNVKTMTAVFSEALSFNGDIGGWDVSNVEKMDGMFSKAQSFNQDIGDWDVSKVTFTALMFSNATSFNQDLNRWDVSKVTAMNQMFSHATSFNGDISGWNVSKVKSFASLFNDATSFNRDISDWNVSSATTMNAMFLNATSFNQNIGKWNFSNNIGPINMGQMFSGATSFNGDVDNWDVFKVKIMFKMFEGAKSFNRDLSKWDVSNVATMYAMFSGASSFNQDIGSWNISDDVNLTHMLDSSGLSQTNYDQLLMKWANKNVPRNKSLGAAGLKYCMSADRRLSLINNKGWDIIGDVMNCPQPDEDNIIYVDQRVDQKAMNYMGDGSSWANAIPELADALKWADDNKDNNLWDNNNPLKIYVANGTYLPKYSPADGTSDPANPSDNRDKSFLMVKNVQLYGGFAPDNNILKLEDNRIMPRVIADGLPEANSTILSGDLGVPDDVSDNAYHVIVASGDAGTAILDGFLITGGNADGGASSIKIFGNEFKRWNAGGIHISNSSPRFRNLVISRNSADNYGGGIGVNLIESSFILYNSLICHNTAQSGSAMAVFAPPLTHLYNVTITQNHSEQGSSIFGLFGSVGTLNNSIISEKEFNSLGVSLIRNSLIIGDSTKKLNDGMDGGGNIITLEDPFVDAENGDYRLKPCAEAYNRADDQLYWDLLHEAAPEVNASPKPASDDPVWGKDLAGQPRYVGHAIDMGAYEYQGEDMDYSDVVFGDTEAEYTGIAQQIEATHLPPGITVSYAIKDAQADIVTEAINAGTYTFTATLSGCGPEVELTAELIIQKTPLIVKADDDSKVYDAQPYSGGKGVTYDGLVNGETESVLRGNLIYSGNAQDATEAGSYEIEPEGLEADNYDISFEPGALTVHKKQLELYHISGLLHGESTSLPYYLEEFPLIALSNVVNLPIVFESSDPSVLDIDGTVHNAGVTTIKALQEGDANHEAAEPIEIEVIIEKGDLTIHALPGAKMYDGIPFEGGFKVVFSGFKGIENKSVLSGTLEYGGTSQGAVDVGDYTIVPFGFSSDNYNLNYASETLVIYSSDKDLLEFSNYSSGQTIEMQYGGSINAEASSLSGTEIKYISMNPAVAVVDGQGQITAVGLGQTQIHAIRGDNLNYKIPPPAVLHVEVSKAPLKVIALNDSKEYDGQPYSGGNGVWYEGLVNGETESVLTGRLKYSGDAKGATRVGSYTVVPGGLQSDNYEISYESGSLTIEKAAITGIIFEDAKFTYDDTAKSLSIAGTLPIGTAVSYSNNNQTEAGVYTVTAHIEGGNNYKDAFLTAELRIEKAKITGITLDGSAYAYDGTERSLAITGTLPSGASVSYTNNNQTEAGVHHVKATIKKENYQDLELNAELIIDKAVPVITAEETQTHIYDGTIKNVMASLNHKETDLSYSPMQGYIDAGTYEITISSRETTNYNATSQRVQLVISPNAFSDLKFSDRTVVYNGQVHHLHVEGLPEGSSVIYDNNGQVDVGTYTVSAKVYHPNYQEETVRAILTIKKANQEISFEEVGTVSRDANRVPLKVSSNNGLPVTVKSDDPLVATVDGGDLLIHRLGTVRLTASQEGDKNHEAAEPVSITVHVADEEEGPVKVHQAFSPNGDGINDFLIIEGIKDYPENRLQVMSRNGLMVFDMEGYDNETKAFRGISNTRVSSETLSEGTYFYVLRYRDGGIWRDKKGWFVLKM